MFEDSWDVVLFAGAGAAGGLIYWATRHHGAVFEQVWTLLMRR